MEQNYASVQERTDILNKDADQRSILDSIDRPIRPLVIELNRIGLITTFSCCGYTYDGQEEPKTHDTKAYVLFRVPWRENANDHNNFSIQNFFRLTSVSISVSWGVCVASNGTEWCLNLMIPELWKKSDNLSETIHDYELKLIGITKLTRILKDFPSAAEKFNIQDGNAIRRASYGEEWIVVPKKTVTLEAGKIHNQFIQPE